MSGRRGRNPLPFVVNSALVQAPRWQRAFGGDANVASDSITFSLPAGGAGQLLVAMVAYRAAATFSMPSGWTQVHQISNANVVTGASGISGGFMAWKVRGVSETAPTFTRIGGNRAVGWLLGYTPPSGAVTFDTFSQQLMPANTNIQETASITVAQVNSLLVVMVATPVFDINPNISMYAASLSATAPNGALVSPAGGPVDTSRWGWTFYNAQSVPTPQVSAHGFDLAGVPAGATGTFQTVMGGGRSLMVAAAFRYS